MLKNDVVLFGVWRATIEPLFAIRHGRRGKLLDITGLEYIIIVLPLLLTEQNVIFRFTIPKFVVGKGFFKLSLDCFSKD